MIKQLPNGNLVVPVRLESEDGQVVGDGAREIGPDHPDYDAYRRWLASEYNPS